MHTKKGFTLVELMVAATIIGILAVFATTQYRNSAAETRWQHAKAKADQLAFAVKRAQLDYPGLAFTADNMVGSSETTCSYVTGMTTPVAPSTLISCGYLENSGWSEGEYFTFQICGADVSCEAGYEALVTVKNTARLPEAYKGYRYMASASKTGAESITQ